MPPPSRLRPLLYLTTASASGLAAYHLTPSRRPYALDASTFQPWTLLAKHPLSATNGVLTLSPPSSSTTIRPQGSKVPAAPSTSRPGASTDGDRAEKLVPARTPYDDLYKSGTWSVEAKHPQLMVSREYTPLPPYPPMVPASTSAAEQEEEVETLDLLIRKDGETSRFLHSVPSAQEVQDGRRGGGLGAGAGKVELRGPHVSLHVPEDTVVEEVLFLAGGTGVAPALQMAWGGVLRACERSAGTMTGVGGSGGIGTHMTLLWASRGREDCEGGETDGGLRERKGRWPWSRGTLGSSSTASDSITEDKASISGDTTVSRPESRIVAHIRALQSASTSFSPSTPFTAAATSSDPKLEVAYFVDAESSFITPAYLRKVLQRSSSRTVSTNTPASTSTSSSSSSQLDQSGGGLGMKLLIVSGPPGFVAHFAGEKIWADGVEQQGPLGGVLGELRREGLLKGWRVWKL
ncbi:hypothetical protein K461DRAFT_275394 [Myriangium duriaei CBS 260.36]|uniref:FAD-binding FR-type domain-containing protein n=1 Tax=Myriangium duriaei CBS 260.36 TaxID=1168546 RepID=A0A9P4J6H4_9PEZI|nr:hypothetical protein K461DRAFT_275394 [Myriangium duriaei CBS 260.36]